MSLTKPNASGLNQFIEQSNQAQAIELSNALQQLNNNPEQLSKFLEDSKSGFLNEVATQKENTIQKIYGDMKKSSSMNNTMLGYHLRNQQLLKAEDTIYQDKRKDAQQALYDKSNNARQFEINQWEIGNRLDTLFVFQQIFIVIATIIILRFFNIKGFIPKSIYYTIIGILIVIVILSVIYRYRYTRVLRNQRYWNRRVFPGYNIQPSSSEKCNGGIMSGLENIYDSTKSGISTMYSDASSAVSNVTSAAESAMNTFNEEYST